MVTNLYSSNRNSELRTGKSVINNGNDNGNKLEKKEQTEILHARQGIDVIASFNPKGIIKPLYFEYPNSYIENLYIKIEDILSIKEEHFAGIAILVYNCLANFQNRSISFTLRYYILNHQWEIIN